MRAAILVLTSLLALGAVAQETHVGRGDEQRLKVLRQRVRTQPYSSAWEELAPVNLWDNPDLILDAGQRYLLLSGYWVMYVVDLKTGKGWAHYSGGDRTPQGELVLSPDEQYTLKFGQNQIECYRSSDGKALWTYDPSELTTIDPIHFENGHAWLLEDYPGKVACVDLATGKKLWYRSLESVIPR